MSDNKNTQMDNANLSILAKKNVKVHCTRQCGFAHVDELSLQLK